MPDTGNIIQTGEPSSSALRIAKLRAAHQLLDDPRIFDDPIALPILGKEWEAAVRSNPYQFNEALSRSMRAAMVMRAQLAEDELARAVKAGVKQVVILGAGLDTFAYRNPHVKAGLTVFEVDHPSTQIWKRSILQQASIPIPASTRFVAVDFENDKLAGALKKAGFRSDLPAYFSWLGVVIYLSPEAVFSTLKFVASLPPRTAITFDYSILNSMLSPLERIISDFLARSFAEQGEPWISFFDPEQLADDMRSLGFSISGNFGPEEMNARYLAGRMDGLTTAGGYRMMCATKKKPRWTGKEK